MVTEPLRHGPPLRGNISVPAIVIRHHHLDQFGAHGGEAFQRSGQAGKPMPHRVFGLWCRWRDPVRLTNEHQSLRANQGADQVDRAAGAAADPGCPDTRHQVVGRRVISIGTRITMHEAHSVLDLQLGGPLPGGSQEDLADIDSHPADPMVSAPGAQHFAFAAAQIEQPLIFLQAAHHAQEAQLLLGIRVENPMLSLGDLVKA